MNTEAPVDRSELRSIREGLQLTQGQMAQAMGVPLRTYQDIEGGVTATRLVHINAARWAAVMHAANRHDGDFPVAVTDAVMLAYSHLFGEGTAR